MPDALFVAIHLTPLPFDRHDLYKWQADQRRRPRAASFAGSTVSRNPAFAHIHEPGGFRRNYVLLRAEQEGAEEPQMLRSFIEFLYIFGHFVSALYQSHLVHPLIGSLTGG